MPCPECQPALDALDEAEVDVTAQREEIARLRAWLEWRKRTPAVDVLPDWVGAALEGKEPPR